MPMLGFLQICVQIDQHFTVHHADFVDDQVSSIGPIFPLVAYFFLALFANWKIAGAVKGNARDIESGRASGGGNDQLILSTSTANNARTAAMKRLFPVPPS